MNSGGQHPDQRIIYVFPSLDIYFSPDKGRPLPKFGEWDVNDPASAEGFTVIFNKARDEKKTGGKPESPAKNQPTSRPGMEPTKSQPSVANLVVGLVANSFGADFDASGNTMDIEKLYEYGEHLIDAKDKSQVAHHFLSFHF
uniref:RIN4 pathogenic type III effector avirulence factor Avr cleavage site domain-containing protein n=1 Tax=Chenopodium quinoa TaxID=63459 RepID=A0A803LQ92_CHEQI